MPPRLEFGEADFEQWRERFEDLRADGLTVLAAENRLREEFPFFTDRMNAPGSIHKFLLRETLARDEQWQRHYAKAPEPHLPPPQLDELVIPNQDALVISDAQIPLHDKDTMADVLWAGREAGAEALVLNGDTIDLGEFRPFPDPEVPTFEDSLAKTAAFMRGALDLGYRRIYAVKGNHDDRIGRASAQRFQFMHLMELVAAQEPGIREHLTITNRYYLIMESGTDGIPWRFTHQKPYSVVPLSVARALATKYQMHILTGHQHHLARCRDISGRLHCVDGGTLQDREITRYIYERDAKNPIWNLGAVLIKDGEPQLIGGTQ